VKRERSDAGRELVGRNLRALNSGKAPLAARALPATANGAIGARARVEDLGAGAAVGTPHIQLLVVGYRM
jgi:hypothetical protein